MFKFTILESSAIPIDLGGVLPETLQGLSLEQVSRLPILHGNRTRPLGDLFRLERATESRHFLLLEGDCSRVKNIGAGMTWGFLWVHGSVGCHAGSRMTGGDLRIRGDAGDWLGAEMSGGSIDVSGSAGSQVGAAYRGSRRGMSGGSIRIEQHAGDEVGLLMRRGVIRIDGNCGAFAGASMIAGTIDVGGSLGPCAGAGMKRGTIITGKPFESSPGIRYACDCDLQFLSLIQTATSIRCYRGDVMCGGRGEILEVI